MVFDITYLKKIRKQLNLTQYQFAKEAQISQSMVAKIESGKLDPTYSYVKRIEETIQILTKNQDKEKQAKDIMHRTIITLNKYEKLENAIKLFSKHNISQIPIKDKNKIVGLLTESSILNNLQNDLKNRRVEELMEEAPPIITKNAKMAIINSLLKFYPMLIVQDNGNLTGVITKADILKNIA